MSRPMMTAPPSSSSSSFVDSLSVAANQCRFENGSRWFSSNSSNSSSTGEDPNANQTEEAAAEESSTTTDEATTAAGDKNDNETTSEELQAQISKLQGEVKTFKDQLLRSLAEQENTRQIAKRDVSAAKNYAIKSFAKSLLEVSDNLHRALEAVPEEALLSSSNDSTDGNNNNNSLKTLYEGVKMTNDGLTKAFQANGIQAYCQQPGDVFDPTKHEALMEYPDPSKEPGTVGQVIKVGFTLNDRVLRPAEVGVVKKV